jgi:exodeoxyribonuclease VII small subunit
MTAAAQPANIEGLSFEQALAELETIVAELESGQAPRSYISMERSSGA